MSTGRARVRQLTFAKLNLIPLKRTVVARRFGTTIHNSKNDSRVKESKKRKGTEPFCIPLLLHPDEP